MTQLTEDSSTLEGAKTRGLVSPSLDVFEGSVQNRRIIRKWGGTLTTKMEFPTEVQDTGNQSPWDLLLDEVIKRATRKTERKQDRSRRTEKQILNAALRVFGRDGISRARIADIAAEAGISTSTLYEYYASKEDLAYDIPMAHLSEFFISFRDATSGDMSARERLNLYLTMSADYAREHAEWARLLYLEIWPSVFVSETDLQTNINDFTLIIRHLVHEGQSEGWISTERNTYETAALIVGASNQLIITWLLYRKPRNLTKAGSEMADRLASLLELEAKAS